MARYDDLNTSAIAYTAFISSILLIIIILLGRALCYAWLENEDERKLVDAHYVSSDQEISKQREVFASYKKVQVEVAPPEGSTTDSNATDGGATEPQTFTEQRLHIPIDQAKKLLLDEVGREPKT